MRNKKLAKRRLQTLSGKLKTLDLHIHRGGNREEINSFLNFSRNLKNLKQNNNKGIKFFAD